MIIYFISLIIFFDHLIGWLIRMLPIEFHKGGVIWFCNMIVKERYRFQLPNQQKFYFSFANLIISLISSFYWRLYEKWKVIAKICIVVDAKCVVGLFSFLLGNKGRNKKAKFMLFGVSQFMILYLTRRVIRCQYSDIFFFFYKKYVGYQKFVSALEIFFEDG